MEFPDINFSNTNHNIFFTKTYFTKTSRNLQLPFFGVFNNKTLCDVCLKWPQDGPSTWTPSLGWKGASNKGPETGKSSWSTQAQQAGPSWGLSWFFHENRHGFSQGKGWHWGYTQHVDFDDVVPTNWRRSDRPAWHQASWSSQSSQSYSSSKSQSYQTYQSYGQSYNSKGYQGWGGRRAGEIWMMSSWVWMFEKNRIEKNTWLKNRYVNDLFFLWQWHF